MSTQTVSSGAFPGGGHSLLFPAGGGNNGKVRAQGRAPRGAREKGEKREKKRNPDSSQGELRELSLSFQQLRHLGTLATKKTLEAPSVKQQQPCLVVLPPEKITRRKETSGEVKQSHHRKGGITARFSSFPSPPRDLPCSFCLEGEEKEEGGEGITTLHVLLGRNSPSGS